MECLTNTGIMYQFNLLTGSPIETIAPHQSFQQCLGLEYLGFFRILRVVDIALLVSCYRSFDRYSVYPGVFIMIITDCIIVNSTVIYKLS